ncbi:MAG: beta-propeller domain-containing protein [Oscillospiraceae bacterium]|nr:beta-propeller domain-containing protein [Oscillospiraceae bacterium]
MESKTRVESASRKAIGGSFAIKALAISVAVTLAFVSSVYLLDAKVLGAGRLGEYAAFYLEHGTYVTEKGPFELGGSDAGVAPYRKGGVTYVPVAALSAALGAKAVDGGDGAAMVTPYSGKAFTVAVGSDSVTESGTGKAIITMPAIAEARDGLTYAPAESLAEAMGLFLHLHKGLLIFTKYRYSPETPLELARMSSLISGFTGLRGVRSMDGLQRLIGYLYGYKGYGYASDDGGEILMYDAPDIAMGADMGESGPMDSVPSGSQSKEAGRSAEMPTQTSPPGESASDGDGGSDHSVTNTQVAGVDEADIIKTDGSYIYYVRGGGLEIVKVGADGELDLVSTFRLPYGMGISLDEVYLDADKVIAVGWYYGDWAPYTMAVVIDVGDKAEPSLERVVEAKGQYVTSRKVGPSVYLVTREYVWYRGGVSPMFRDTALGDGYVDVGCQDIMCFPDLRMDSVTTLVGFNVDRPDEAANVTTYIGGGENVYMSANALYIASSSYNDGGNETVVHKFLADDGELVYVHRGTAPGSVLNQFSMDEYGSHFRIVTTSHKYDILQRDGWLEYANHREANGLYVFDGGMALVGRIDDIAPGEVIYSARFMGARAYMVTFKTVDPLFAIDLSDPANPTVMGALKIPGYSSYLHPYDENHLIGIGKDTVVDSYGNAFYTSMKISMFDVTDITDPIEMFVETIGGRGTESALLWNHKALLFSRDKGLLAFPIEVYETSKPARDGEMPEYGRFTFAGAYVYDVSLDGGFALRGKVSHLSDQDMLLSSDWGADRAKYVERLLTVRGNLYAASHARITSHDIDTLELRHTLTFMTQDAPRPYYYR